VKKARRDDNGANKWMKKMRGSFAKRKRGKVCRGEASWRKGSKRGGQLEERWEEGWPVGGKVGRGEASWRKGGKRGGQWEEG
jgi:hypothetical protein